MQKVKKVLKSDLGKSISSGYLLFIVNNVVALFLTPYMLQFITKEEYGLYILCVDFLAWVGFLEFGTNKVIESKAAHLIVQGNYEGLNKTFNSSFFFQLIVGLMIIPFYFFLITFGISKTQLSHLNIIIILFAISAGLTVFRNLFSSVIIASKKVHLDNRIQLAMNVLNYILILFLVPFVGVLGLAIINLTAIVLMLIRSNYRVKKLFPTFKIDGSLFDKTELKSLVSHGIYFSLGSLATIVLVKLDSFIIGREFGLAEVASYFITIKLFMLLQKVIEMAINNFRPHIAHLYGKKEFGKIKLFYELILFLIICVSTILVSIIIFLNEFFVDLWVGKGYFIGEQFNLLFGFYLISVLITLPSRIVLVSSLYKVKSLNLYRVFEGVLRICIIYALLKLTSINILPISSIISIYLFGILFFHFQLKSYFKINLSTNVKTYLPFITAILLIPLIFIYFDIPNHFNLITIPIISIIFIYFLKMKWNEIKNLSSIVFKS